MANKVKFNIHDLHYAPITSVNADGSFVYGDPVPLKGAKSISLEPQGNDNDIFYADGIDYYVQNGSTGYEGDLEVALITDEFRAAIFGEQTDSDGNMWENTEDEAKKFALGFVIDGNEKSTYFWYQNVSATKPNVASETNEEQKTIGTDTITLMCSPNKDGNIRVKSTSTTSTASISGWFDEVIAAPSSLLSAPPIDPEDE